MTRGRRRATSSNSSTTTTMTTPRQRAPPLHGPPPPAVTAVPHSRAKRPRSGHEPPAPARIDLDAQASPVQQPRAAAAAMQQGLRELAVWGFHDRETNIHMLEAFGGNVQAALLQLQQLG